MYQNTPEPFYSDIHFLHLQTLTSAIPSNGIIACLARKTKSADFHIFFKLFSEHL